MKNNKFEQVVENIIISEGLWDKVLNFLSHDLFDGLPKDFPIVEIQRFCRDNDFFMDENRRNRFYTYLISRLNQIGYILSFEIPIVYIREKRITEDVITEGFTGFNLKFMLKNIDTAKSKTWSVDINYKTKADEITKKIDELISPYGLQFHHNGRYPYTDEIKERYMEWLKKYEKEFRSENKPTEFDEKNKKEHYTKPATVDSRRLLLDDENMKFVELLGFFTLYGFEKMENTQNIYIKNQDEYRLTVEINYDDFKNHQLKRDLNLGVFSNRETREETFKLKPTKDVDQEKIKNDFESFVHKTFKDSNFKLIEKL